jgi:fatty acid desaturase
MSFLVPVLWLSRISLGWALPDWFPFAPAQKDVARTIKAVAPELLGGIAASTLCLFFPLLLPSLSTFPTWAKITLGIAPFLGQSLIFTLITHPTHLHHSTDSALVTSLLSSTSHSTSGARRQVLSAVDYAPDSPFWGLVSGGLNAQSLHHLVPTVHSRHYISLYPIYRECKRRWGVEGVEKMTLWEVAGDAHEYVKQINKRGKGVGKKE